MPDTHQSDQRSAAGQQKPLSRKAAVAEAKRRHAAAVAALSAVGPAPLPILDARVSAKIAYYRPQGFDPRLWDQIAAVCRDLARYYAPRNGTTAVNVLWHLCRFTGWAAHQPHRADTSTPGSAARVGDSGSQAASAT